jgi:phosphatidate cytidylyltransferase
VGDLRKRVFSALALGPLVILLFLLLPPGFLFLFMGLVLVVAVYELASIARASNRYAITLFAAVSFASLYTGRPSVYLLWLVFSPALYLLMRMVRPSGGSPALSREIGGSITVLLLSEVFLAFPLFFLYRLKELDPYLPLILLLTIWASDTAAYLVGRSVGRHKLAPLISPKKTLEGLAGAAAGALLVTLLFRNRMAMTTPAAVGIGVAIGILGQMGDVLESIAKRVWEVKDSSSLIPGHGGILDRIDSFLLTAPFMYHYLSGIRG